MVTRSLKNILDPYVKSIGFKGTFPQYYKIDEMEYKFISIQFGLRDLSGKFICQLGRLEKDKVPEWAKVKFGEKLSYGLATKIFRVGQRQAGQDGTWFDFTEINSLSESDVIATKVMRDLEKDITFLAN